MGKRESCEGNGGYLREMGEGRDRSSGVIVPGELFVDNPLRSKRGLRPDEVRQMICEYLLTNAPS
jgi:hypothetical protein